MNGRRHKPSLHMARKKKAKPEATPQPTPQPTQRMGNSPEAKAHRYRAFAAAYLANGHNATQAARTSGFAGRQAGGAGWKLLQKPEVQALIAAHSREVAAVAEMDTTSWARELKTVAFSNVADLVGPDGSFLKINDLPMRVQGAIASVKMRSTPEGDTIEYKFWNKTSALEIMARHLGLFERDNAQQQSDIKVQVVLVG